MRRRSRSVTANPVLVGAVTTLIVVVAVFLAYNANQGLPFVPTTQLDVEVPNASKLVVGNEVREGGLRIGVVDKIEPVASPDGSARARLVLKLDKKSAAVPADSEVVIRPRSALGLKYVELQRGSSQRELQDGDSLSAGAEALSPELEDFFELFDEETRRDSQANLGEFGAAFAGRGEDLNDALEGLPRFFGSLAPVARILSDEATRLPALIGELADAAAITAPVARQFGRGFTDAAATFEALSRDERALRQTIAKSPGTLDVAIRSLRAQRPFLTRFAGISDELRGTARQLRTSLPPTNSALRAGVEVLPRTPALNRRLEIALRSLERLTEDPGTSRAVGQLVETVDTLNPTLRYVGPFVTVCNYWNYWWTFLSDHLSEEDATGTLQRIQAKTAPIQNNSLSNFGAAEPANGEGYVAASAPFGDPAFLHSQPYGRAVNERGEADCENGQRGYPERVAAGADPRFRIALDPRTPGDQGPTFDRFEGRTRVGLGPARVPKGQTFSAEPQNGLDFVP